MNTSIKSWSEDERPREKLLLKGKDALSDSELLAILIGSGFKAYSAVDLSREILSAVNNDLNKLARMSIGELQQFKGIGPAKAISVYAALELGRRKNRLPEKKKHCIHKSSDAFRAFYPYFSDAPQEMFYALYMNQRNAILEIRQISSGGLTGTVADGRVIFKHALDLWSTGVIVAHNHPSGQLKPSNEDRKLTKNLVEFGNMINIRIMDHLIITDNNYFSFADEGILI